MASETYIDCPASAPKRCAFCGERSVALCDWPVERAKLVPVESLKPGDRIFPFSDGKGVRKLLSISAIMQSTDTRRIAHWRAVWEWNGEPQPPMIMKVNGRAKLAVPGTCDKPCCERHHRSVGEDRDYCQDHAREQDEMVAKESHG